VKAEEMVV
jgi:hypothetical protein